MTRVVLATRNAGKLAELRDLASGLGLEVVGLDAFPSAPEVEETGTTFEENAAQKARSAARATGLWAIADDSGLCVHALGGQPGVRSARYAADAGEGEGDAANNARLLRALAGVPPAARGATFVCVIALAAPSDGNVEWVRGEWQGAIAPEPRGRDGFGYDPLFLISGRGKTAAELGSAYKRRESHRARAFHALIEKLREKGLAPAGPVG